MTTAQQLYAAILPHALGAYVTKTPDMDSAKQMASNLSWEVVAECGRLGLLADVPATPVDTARLVEPGPAPLATDTGIAVQPQREAQGPAKFLDITSSQQGSGPAPLVAPGTPYQPAQHYASAQQPPAPAAPVAAPPPNAANWYPPHLAYMHQPSPAPYQPPQVASLPQGQVATGAGTVATQTPMYDVAGMRIIPPAGNTYQPPAQAGVMTQVTHIPTPQGHSALGTDGVISQPSQRPNTQDTVVAPASQLVVQQAGGAGTQFVPEHIVR